MDYSYCSIEDFKRRLDLLGISTPQGYDADGLMLEIVKAATRIIERETNGRRFIPWSGTKRYDGDGTITLFVDDLISVTSIVDDDDTLVAADYLLYPRNAANQDPVEPYLWIDVDPDADTISAWTDEADIVVITGLWGWPPSTVDTGADVASITAAATTLSADRGDVIRIGHVLLVESEQMFVTDWDVTDSGADLDEVGNITATATNFTVDAGHGLVKNEVIRIDQEDMLVQRVATNELYVVRGWHGTEKVAHSDNVGVYVHRSYTVVRGVNGTTAAAHTAKDINRYQPIYDIWNATCELGARMYQQAQAGYQDATGLPEMGQLVFSRALPAAVYTAVRAYRQMRI